MSLTIDFLNRKCHVAPKKRIEYCKNLLHNLDSFAGVNKYFANLTVSKGN